MSEVLLQSKELEKACDRDIRSWTESAPSLVLARELYTFLIGYTINPENEMATHSSVLAWRIPGTEEPAGLPSMGSHRVGHD